MTQNTFPPATPEAIHFAEAYARQRARDTRKPYLITNMGHVWLDCPLNRRHAPDCHGIYAIVRPSGRIRLIVKV